MAYKATGHIQLDSPVAHAEDVDISTSDHTFTHVTRALYVGTGGDVELLLLGDTASVVWHNVSAGTVLPVRAQKVVDNNTTAGDMIGAW